MPSREAACHCGQLRLEVEGEPFAVSICNCLDCQRRTGSAFGMQAGFKAEQAQVVGRYSDFTRVSDEADRKEHVFHFCPTCGSQVFYTEPSEPDLVVVSVGSFADPTFPPPTESGYDSRRHPWVELPDSIHRFAPEVSDAARSLFNRACGESLAGDTAAAIEHLRDAIALWEGCRELARNDSDFDAIRDEPAFQALVG